jgi:peptide/nickel transport system substrate-binding protein
MRRINFCPIIFFLLIAVFGSIAEAQSPRYGGTLVVSNRADVTSLNPIWKYDSPAYQISQNIYSTLIITDYGPTALREPYGDLAKSWDISKDGLTYTFHLYENVYWHDGVKFSSADVKFTYETAKREKYPIAEYLELVKEIATPDDNTVVFKLSKPDAPFIPMLAIASNWYGQIIAKHLYDGTDILKNPYNKKPVGTGPFTFVEWKPGQFVTLKANEKYFRGRPYLDVFINRLYSSKEVAQADFRSGVIDVLKYEYAPPPNEIKAWTALPGIKLWRKPSIYSYDIQFNHKRKPFTDIRVREAISLAIDREEVSNVAWAGLAAPNYNASCQGARDFTNVNVRWPKPDLKRAKQLLDEAGYPAGADGIRMRLTSCGFAQFRDLADVIIQQLKRVGIELKFDLVDTATWYRRSNAGDFDLNLFYHRYGPDPDTYRENFGSNGSRNHGKYSNATVDELLEAGRKTLELPKRKQIYNKLQEVLLKDFAYIPVIEYEYFTFSKDKVHGMPGDPNQRNPYGLGNYSSVWIEK